MPEAKVRPPANPTDDSRRVHIHPTAEVSALATIGEGTRIWHQVQVRERARIGKSCIIGKGVYIDSDVVIGDRVKIQNGASIYHGVTIEDGVFIGPHACLTNDRLPRAITPDGELKRDADWEVGKTLVQYGASIGAGAIILPGVTVGRFALVGAGAVVTRDVAAQTLVVGNPARPVGFVCMCGHRLDPQRGGAEYLPPRGGTPFAPGGEDPTGEYLPESGQVTPEAAGSRATGNERRLTCPSCGRNYTLAMQVSQADLC